MAEWNAGIKLLLAAYKGPTTIVSRDKNSLSDLLNFEKADLNFKFIFESENFFSKLAFNPPPNGSTKGTNLQHYFNNLIYSPSRKSESLEKELPKLLNSDGFLILPLKDQFIRWKWFVEGTNEIKKCITEQEYVSAAQGWNNTFNFLNPFEFLGVQSYSNSVKTTPIVSNSSHNVILYGPPGTGKTRAAAVIANEILTASQIDLDPEKLNLLEAPKNFLEMFKDKYFSTQFHPSFSYEDFFEGLRPVNSQSNDRKEVSYTVVPGIFKVVCQLAHAYLQPKEFSIDLEVKFTVDIKGNKKWFFSECLNQSIYALNERVGYYTFQGKEIGYTGKGSENKIVDEAIFPTSSGNYQIKWFYDGNDANIEFVLFIDELNRGNPARIFGEALSLIEETKRFGKPEQSNIILPYSHELFTVPPNVNIICAMNSSDKSLANIDHAFRRRFKFIYLAPSFEIITSTAFKKKSDEIFSDEILISLKNHFQAINDALKAIDIPQESYIGHSYLINLLRAAYSRDRKYKNENTTPRRTVEQLVGFYLVKTWEDELHGLIRDIVGDHKLKLFCENFSNELKKPAAATGKFLSINEDVSTTLFKYLENIQPTRSSFPWKKVA